MLAWLGTVAPSELRKLDLALVHDLLRIANDKVQWSALMRPVVALIDDLMLVGDFEAADGLVGVLASERRSGATHREAATGAIDALVAGPMMRHVAGHLATIEDAPFECVKGVFLALGDSMIPVLAETLLEESHPRTRERLTVMFMAFGASGRREVERFKSSANAAVRRTAVDLLRQFGGSEALSELSGFLNDNEPQVQREAVRAILSIGTDLGYATLGRALTEGTPAQREAMVDGGQRVTRRLVCPAVHLHPPACRPPRPADRSVPSGDQSARLPEGSGRHRSTQRSAASGRVVGAPAHDDAARCLGRRVGANRHPRCRRRPRRGGGIGIPRRACGGARAPDHRRRRRPGRRQPVTLSGTALAEEMLRRFTAAVRSGQLYAPNHPIVGRNVTALAAAIEQLHRVEPSIVIGMVQEEIIVGDVPIARGEGHAGFVRRLKQLGVERVVIERGISIEELNAFMTVINVPEASANDGSGFPALPHIRVGRVSVEPGADGPSEANDIATFRRVYDDAVSAADIVWNSASTERHVDATVAKTMVAGLAQAVSQNRTALLALTTLRNYDNYTFTHMVNVSILTMGQARGLGIDGPLLREFGLAGLMHDIGKVRTPLEILNKTSKLTDDEFTIMKRHPVDGAEILRATPDMSALAPVVAFEHHRRLDGTGYPDIRRDSLNLATALCSISDVYDAMRSQRPYQQAFPSDRILVVLKQGYGSQFDRHLIRRFVQLIGIYPVGSLVRLDTGQVALVVNVHAPDPYRPHVRILMDRCRREARMSARGEPLGRPFSARRADHGRRAGRSGDARHRSADAVVN